MKTPIVRVSLAFDTYSDNAYLTFARNVYDHVYLVPEFQANPIVAPDLLGAIDKFAEKKAAQASGGPPGTAKKNEARAELSVMMKEIALYVQTASRNNLALLLSSGYLAVSTNRTPYPLAKPTIQRVVAGMTGESLVTLSTESASRGSEIRVAEVADDGTTGPFRDLPFSTSSRNIPAGGLIPGQRYAFQGRNVGGSTTYSDWSDLVVQRAS